MANIKTDLTNGLRESLATIYNQVYVVNDWDRMHVWDGYRASMVEAGIRPPYDGAAWAPHPSVAAGGSVDQGAHLFRFRYMDSKTQYVSNPTPPILIEVGTSPANPRVSSLTVHKSLDPKVDTIILEATRAAGDVFFRATAVRNSGQVLSYGKNDTQLAAEPLFYDDFGHEIPPHFAVLEAFRGRLWGLGHVVWSTGKATNQPNTVAVAGVGSFWTSAAKGRILRFSGEENRYFVVSVTPPAALVVDRAITTLHAAANYTLTHDAPDVLFFSKPIFVQSFPTENQIKVLDGRPERGRVARGFRQDMVIFGERNMEVLVFSNDPFEDGRLEPVQGVRGAASERVVVDAGGFLWSLDYKGIHRFAGATGEESEHASEFLDPYFDPGDQSKGYVDFSYRDTFHAVHFPQLHQILWFVVLNGVPGDPAAYERPHHALVLDYLNGTWGLLKFDVAVTCSTNIRGANGRNYTVLGDENGYFWVYGVNTRDGPPSSSVAEVTALTVAGAVVTVPSVLYTQNLGLKGVPAFWPSGNLATFITANSVNRLTLNSVLGGFAAGHQLFLGTIRSKLKSKAFAWWTERMMMRGRYLHLAYQPRTEGEARVRVYLDRSTQADVHAADHSDRGVVISAGRDYATLDLTEKAGRWRVPLPHTHFHVLEWELEIVKPGTELMLLRYEVDGYVSEEDEEA